MSFVITKNFPPAQSSATVPDNSIGAIGDIGFDTATGNQYVKQSSGWILTGAGGGGYSGPITVRNSAGTVTRSLTAANGIVSLAATDAIVANGSTFTLQNSSGVTSSGNAGLNSPATATVAAGVVTSVKASA